MTLFSPHDKKFYTDGVLGPGGKSMDLELWNLLSLSSRMLFGWENGQGQNKLEANFHPDLLLAAEHTLLQKLGDKRVRYYMRLDSPWNFYEALKMHNHDHLEVDHWHRGGLQGLVKARCFAWAGVSNDFVRMHSLDYI